MNHVWWQGFYLKCTSNWRSVFNTPFTQNSLITKRKLPQDVNHNNYVDLVLKTCQRFYPYVFNKWKSLFRKIIFESVYHDTFFFSFRWICWWGCWQSVKASRIQICLFLAVPHLTVIHFIKVKQFVRLSEKLFLMHTFV